MKTVKELLDLVYKENNKKLYLYTIVELSEYKQHLSTVGLKWGAGGEEVKANKIAKYIFDEINKMQELILKKD